MAGYREASSWEADMSPSSAPPLECDYSRLDVLSSGWSDEPSPFSPPKMLTSVSPVEAFQSQKLRFSSGLAH